MGATTLTELDGLAKVVYGDNLVNLIPETAKLSKLIPFSQSEKVGKRFDQPVVLSYEHGVTFGAPGDGAFSLNSSVPMKMQNAEVDPYQIVLRGQMDYETAAKAVSGGEKAFRKATQLQMENMMESATKYLELSMLYGQKGIGQTLSSANTDTTHTVVTLTVASWASGIWAGMENQQIEFWNSSNAKVSSGADAIFTIDSIDIDNRALTVSGTTTGISALDTSIGSYTDDIYWYGARTAASTYKEMIGLDKIISNTTGTLFNISGSTYVAWRGNTYAAGSAALTIGKVFSALAPAIARGLNEKATVFINDKTWANLINDQAALRKYDSSYSTDDLRNGARKLTFYSSNGEVVIEPYNCIKQGEAYILPLKRCKRIGAQDFSFNSLGGDGKIFRELADSAGFEYRVYCSQQVFLESPARAVKITGIVNS